MKPKSAVAAIFAILLPATLLLAQQAGHDTEIPDTYLYTPAEIQWKDGPPSLPRGSQFVILEGNPTTDGMYVGRIKMPDGYHVPPHTHSMPERITVIQGTFKLAIGGKLTLADAKSLPAGTYGAWPAGTELAMWAEGETIVQFHGMGPWGVHYVNPADDPRGAKK